MTAATRPKKVLLLGSGGLKIGQAGEFDYSGSQAIKALREEGIGIVVLNPNVATVQTSDGMADATYLLPVTPEYAERVIRKERPDGILLSFGGQTALNCGVELERSGVLAEYGVAVLGTPVDAIVDTEDRERFALRLERLGMPAPRSVAAATLAEAAAAAERIGYPVMARAAFALGGRGSGKCADRAELEARCSEAFAAAPQVLVEEWLGGWKEIEYEVVRDSSDACVTVCNMENLDPLGIHTGESVVVAPSQTLSDAEYHALRSASIAIVRDLGIVGECNVQFALDPLSERFRVIEVNARLSRSSALASKATGYPLAYVAAKLALGFRLVDIENRMTGATKSCFEPAMDYVVVKAPRWDLAKFRKVDRRIGSEMKSVGEVMAVGRCFEEALQKAVRMTGSGADGLEAFPIPEEELPYALSHPDDRRLHAVYRALSLGWTIERVHGLTRIDPWFLSKFSSILDCEREIFASGAGLPDALMLRAKRLGFSDTRIARATGSTELAVREGRKASGIRPRVRSIDTLAGEYPARANYLYFTYADSADDVAPLGKGALVIGSGAYRIGSSVEFDWCCVHAARAARGLGKPSIMMNCNPETVSTDWDECDRLYFDELSFERVMDAWEFERPEGAICSMGGQTSNNLVLPLSRAGVRIFGTSAENVDKAEDREKFSTLLDALGVEQPAWSALASIEETRAFAKRVGWPVLVRPSYVLSGAAMNVAYDDSSLDRCLGAAAELDSEHPVVVSKFLENAKEVEIDAVARNGEILMYAISEHVENAGVHSGDATVVFPAQRLYVETYRAVKRIARKIAKALDVTGPFNVQFLAKDNRVSVIECNLRASRSFPFCSKVFGKNMISVAARAMLGVPEERVEGAGLDLDRVGVKAAQFSFARLKGADPVPGVEMASTGEVACVSHDDREAFLDALLSTGYVVPRKGVLLSAGPVEDKAEFLDRARWLVEAGVPIHATPGTYRFLADNDVPAAIAYRPSECRTNNSVDLVRNRMVDFVLNVPLPGRIDQLEDDMAVRRAAVDFEVPLMTDVKVAARFLDAARWAHGREREARSLEEVRVPL